MNPTHNSPPINLLSLNEIRYRGRYEDAKDNEAKGARYVESDVKAEGYRDAVYMQEDREEDQCRY
jgi:hypothetical protein